jgi:ubiquinone/menaquinone biosynthesis C-methylase UbiE
VGGTIDTTIHEGCYVPEIAPGPGYLSIEIAKRKKYRITALEISQTFVEIAGNNARQAGVEIDIRQGNASYMPFEDSMFDFAVCTSSFKNFSEPLGALEEIYRVLKPGAKAWINDLRRDVSDRTIHDFVANENVYQGSGSRLCATHLQAHSETPCVLTGPIQGNGCKDSVQGYRCESQFNRL